MSIGIVYYSLYKSTEKAVHIIQEKLSEPSVLIELKEKTELNGKLGFLKGGFQAFTGRTARLTGTPWLTAADFSTLYIASPIWAGRTPPALNTFLQKMDFSYKTVHLITVQADPDHGKSDLVHQQIRDIIEEKGGLVIQTIALHGAKPMKTASETSLRLQLDRISIT